MNYLWKFTFWLRKIDIFIFTFILLPYRCLTIPIDNGVTGSPQISCGAESITLEFRTERPFDGRTFVKGFAYKTECLQRGSGRASETFTLRFDQCGMRRGRQVNGIAMATTVIISFHSIFLTKVDRAYRVSCFYMEADKSVSQSLEVSMLTTQTSDAQTQMPVCRYEILQGGIGGPPVRYARIGEPVYHKWTCDASTVDMYCMRVHTCTVDDGQGGQNVQVIDANGCGIDRHILQSLDYLTDLMAGQEAHVFKFADKPALYFKCQIEIKLKDKATGCQQVKPACVTRPGTTGYQPGPGPVRPTRPPQPTAPPRGGGGSYVTPSYRPAPQPGRPRPQVRPTTDYNVAPVGFRFRLSVLGRAKKVVTVFDREKSDVKRSKRLAITDHVTVPTVNGTRDSTTGEVVADYDLPEQHILVFGLEDVAPNDAGDQTSAEGSEDEELRRGSIHALLDETDGSVCLSNERFAGITISLLAICILSIGALLIAFCRRDAFMDSMKGKNKAVF